MPSLELPRGSIAIVDTSVLFAKGGPSNDKYQSFEEYVIQRDIAVRIPDHVAEELGESPSAYRYQRERLRAAQDAGWLKQGHVDFTDAAVSDVIDRTRKRIHRLSADDVAEDDVEVTDAVLAGLAYQYATDRSKRVAVLVSDTIAERAIEDVLHASGVRDTTAVIEGRRFLASLVDDGFN